MQAMHESVHALDLGLAPDQMLSRVGHDPRIERESLRRLVSGVSTLAMASIRQYRQG